MVKKSYAKPFWVVEIFTAQEYIAACKEEEKYIGWRAYGDMIVKEVYKDINSDGHYTSNEYITGIQTGAYPVGANANNKVCATVAKPTLLTDYNYYSGYDEINTGSWLRPKMEYPYKGQISPIYKHNNRYFYTYEELTEMVKNSS